MLINIDNSWKKYSLVNVQLGVTQTARPIYRLVNYCTLLLRCLFRVATSNISLKDLL